MSGVDEIQEIAPEASVSPAADLLGRLVWLFGAYAALAGLLLVLALIPWSGIDRFRGLATEALDGGVAEASFALSLLSLAPLSAAAVLAQARLRLRRRQGAAALGETLAPLPRWLSVVDQLGSSVPAREGQAVILPFAALIVGLVTWALWPKMGSGQVGGVDANLVAAGAILLAFPSLIIERVLSGTSPIQMPEAAGLRRIVLLTTVGLALAGAGEVGRGLGWSWSIWTQRILQVGAALVLLELALRALARLFLPASSFENAKAVTESILAAILTGGAGAPVVLIRTHLGLDFARSWALSFLTAAAIPALICTLLLCWSLTGVKLLESDQRGVYERFGAPVTVLGPGLHLLLPWPLGRLRPVEYGVVHTIAVGAMKGAGAYERSDQNERVGAEDMPTAAMDRLWDTSHATEAEYLVASQEGGRQEFQAVNAEILVLYRTGMTDAAARQAVYGPASQADVVELEANRLATRYFSSHTLDQVMGGQRQALQETLRLELAAAVAKDRAGVDVVAFLIDAIHPPVGAAAAYHAVQAAQINAETSVSQAAAHAARTSGQAQQEAYQAGASAQGGAVEKVQSAFADAYRFNADRRAYGASPGAFLLERRTENLTKALKGARLILIDHHLSKDQAPLMDLRATSGAIPAQSSAGSGGSGSSGPSYEMSEAFTPEIQPPSTSTEAPAPPATNEQAAEDARSSRQAHPH